MRPPGRPNVQRVRGLLRLIVVLAVLLGMALLATELVAKPYAERAIASRIRDERGLASDPDVDLKGFPFLFAAARGQLDGASVVVEGYDVDGLRLRRATLDLDGIAFSAADLISGSSDVEAERATLVAEVTDADLNSWLATRAIAATVEFAAGTVQVRGRIDLEGIGLDRLGIDRLGALEDLGGDVEARGTVAVVDGSLYFEPDELLLAGLTVPSELTDAARRAVAFAVPLPEVAGVQVTGATVTDGAVTLTADVTDYPLTGVAG